MPAHLVVAGNGMAGQRLVEALRDRDTTRSWRVTVLSEEPRRAYDRVALSSYLDGASADDLDLVPDGCYGRAAVEALASRLCQDPATVLLLHERATSDQDEDVRIAALEALAARWHDDPATVRLLHDRATNDQDEDVLIVGVEALAAGWHDDPATAPLLRDRATNDIDWAVRCAAVEALAAGWYDDPATAPLLRDRATNDQDADVRLAAMDSLQEPSPAATD